VTAIPCGPAHLAELRAALDRFGPAASLADRWGIRLARLLPRGARLLACGNGGSAAQAQHLTAELVGRYCDDRPPYSAPNPLAAACDEALCVDAHATCTVQELHLVAIHLICAAFDVAIGASTRLDLLRAVP
jgi:phosphoheptose isomerase